MAIQAVTFTLGLFIVSFTRHAVLTLVATSVIPMVLIPYAFAMPFVNKLWYMSAAIKEQATSLAYEIFDSIRIVVAFGAEERLASAHKQLLLMGRTVDKKGAPLAGIMLAPMFLACSIVLNA